MGCNIATHVCESIGIAVERECQMRHYESRAPGLLVTLKKKYWHKSIGTHQKLKIVRQMMNQCNVDPWVVWDKDLRIRLGSWLLDCLMNSAHWFFRSHVRFGRKTVCIILDKPEFLEIKDQFVGTSELFSPEAWPMLIEPNDWSNEKAGGYLLNEVMRGHKMVRS